MALVFGPVMLVFGPVMVYTGYSRECLGGGRCNQRRDIVVLFSPRRLRVGVHCQPHIASVLGQVGTHFPAVDHVVVAIANRGG